MLSNKKQRRSFCSGLNVLVYINIDVLMTGIYSFKFNCLSLVTIYSRDGVRNEERIENAHYTFRPILSWFWQYMHRMVHNAVNNTECLPWDINDGLYVVKKTEQYRMICLRNCSGNFRGGINWARRQIADDSGESVTDAICTRALWLSDEQWPDEGHWGVTLRMTLPPACCNIARTRASLCYRDVGWHERLDINTETLMYTLSWGF